MRIYLAGKIALNDWRHEMVAGLSDACYRSETWEDWPVLENAIEGRHEYVGPYFTACGVGHETVHGPSTHGAGLGTDMELRWLHQTSFAGHAVGHWLVSQNCMSAIRRADALFAWLDREDAYGTILEIGFAAGMGKMVVVAGPQHLDELWLAYQFADKCDIGAESPRRAFNKLFPPDYRSMPYVDYLKTDHWQEVRQAALLRAEHACQLCNAREALHVHHRTYERLGEERPADLTVLCAICHAKHHDKLARQPAPKLLTAGISNGKAKDAQAGILR